MVRVNKQTYADYIKIELHQYRFVHGIIEEFGGRVKQFSQDLHDHEDWYIFFEMAKLQEKEFLTSMRDYFNGKAPE